MKPGETFLPDGFALTESTRAWLEKRYPTVDAEETIEIFADKARARGWVYRDWQAAFRNYVRGGQQYGGVVYKAGRAADPRWQPVLDLVAPFGFRVPLTHETPQSYRTAFDLWRAGQKHHVIDTARALKSVG